MLTTPKKFWPSPARFGAVRRFSAATTASLAFTLWVPLVSAAGAEPLDTANPPQGRFSDDWAEIFIGGAKSGYAHSTMARDGNIIRTKTAMHLKIDRAGQTVQLGVLQETTELLEGTPLEFSSTMDLSFAKMTTQGKVKDGRVELVSSQYGMEQKQVFDFPAGAAMTWGAYRESLRHGFKPGTEYTLTTYSPELRMDGPVLAKTRVGEWESFQHRGKEVRGQKVVVTMETPIGSMDMISWVDEAGNPLKAKVPMQGLAEMEIITTDQASALSEFVPPEVFMNTVVKAKQRINRETVRRIQYRVSLKEGSSKLDEISETGMQKCGQRTDKTALVTVTRQAHQLASGQASEKPSAALEEYLTSNLLINLGDPTLIELARKAAGGEPEPFALGDKLRRFVTDYVSAKSMNVGFATASEVARTKEGDCSEHAVLLAALGRLSGLPSRVVVGLAYAPFFGGQDDIFGYHMWTQFWIGGQWYDFDAALRETECSPARIAFATSSLKDAGLADLSLALLSTIGAIDLEILEVEH